MVEMVKSNLSHHDHPSYHGLISCLARDCFRNYFKEARKGFFGCYSVCETMKDTKEGYFIM